MKSNAILLRKTGRSIRDIELRLGIPRSTLSGWFKYLKIARKYRVALFRRWKAALAKARIEAAKWRNAQKQKRLDEAKKAALKIVNSLNFRNKNLLDLALAMLYLGEGAQNDKETSMGNSDPNILRFFINVLNLNYGLDKDNIKCELHLRADQNADAMKKWWAAKLRLSLKNFTYVYFDKRTKGTKTFDHYKGVCLVRCGNVAIQRKLVNIGKEFCNRVTNKRA